MSPLKIVCRGSKLSLAQVEIFKRKLLDSFPNETVEIIIKETEGDLNQNQALSEMEGRDFFTKDIQDYLLKGQADFAVHSMKDVSGENFFKDNSYAIIERDDFRDVAIFNEDILLKIEREEKIRLGASSPRRVEMAISFLEKAMPVISDKKVKLEAVSIRGNVDTRLRKLNVKEYDGLVLACAGLNRLLRADEKDEIALLLKSKKLMILPVMDCPPAPGQGAIVVETSKENIEAKEILNKLNDEKLAESITKERNLAHHYGSGCHQKFGVVHVDSKEISFTYGAGKDRADKEFERVVYANDFETGSKAIYSTADYLNSLFNEEYSNAFKLSQSSALYIASKNPLQQSKILKAKRIWVANTTDWFNLAKQGVWVEGSSENLGIEFIKSTLASPLVNIKTAEISILSDDLNAAYWKQLGFDVVIYCKSSSKVSTEVKNELAKADFIYWTNFWEYQLYKEVLKKNVVHGCAPDETFDHFVEVGIKPIVFPGLKAFEVWRSNTVFSEG